MPLEKVVSGAYTAGQHRSVTGAVVGTPIAAADDINMFVDPAATFVTDGVLPGDTLVVINDATRDGSYTVAEVYDEQRLRTTTAFVGATNTTMQYYIIRGTGTPIASTLCTVGVATLAPDLYTADAGIAGLAAHVGAVLRIVSDDGGDGIGPIVDINAGDWLITTSPVVTPATWTPVSAVAFSAALAGVSALFGTVVSVTVARAVTSRRVFRIITDIAATFSTDLVQAGDLLQVPDPVSGTSYDETFDYTVAYIPNENDIVLAANTDVVATVPTTGDVTLAFRISRLFSKNDQIDELVAIAQSFNSRRVVLVWPDEVDVTGLVDGSKPRTDAAVPEAASVQPGYYLSGVVGGMTAGLPSHQGFTNLGIAGVNQINHSTRYFSDTQLTELSDGGWYVFAQDTPNTLPVCIHQLTTDPDTLETGEYSVVKNFDFVAIFFADILASFIGDYNINDENLALMGNSLEDGIDVLKLRRFAKIGATINDADVTSIAQHETLEDRVEVFMDVDLPKPLNRVGLHLISV